MSPRSSTERVASHGRGGAGNIVKDDPNSHIQSTDLVTPTLKSDLYTTGRGGTGNMARNDPNHPEIARAAQDVEAPGYRDGEGPHFYGRGGAANYAKAIDAEHKNSDTKQNGVKDKGFVEKIKEKLGSNKN